MKKDFVVRELISQAQSIDLQISNLSIDFQTKDGKSRVSFPFFTRSRFALIDSNVLNLKRTLRRGSLRKWNLSREDQDNVPYDVDFVKAIKESRCTWRERQRTNKQQ
ncbi:hypothetical protein QVD17_05846 [Tagetes erecta]|uniref:Uncharacterized protein n=1 Tax=Tagetes erecta TaxID=13708 RepID=A0AAD8LJG4_TARER|nr:hypothetical protein QVD17_05846 [Tagetes erecta]